MKTGRIIGWALLALALALVLLGHEALIALGELWFRLDQALGTASLNLTQAVVQRYVWAWLWEGVIQNILTAPAWLVFALPGLLLIWLCRSRGKVRGLRR